MIKGIYTLANDAVFDQLVAFLNSIEANIGFDIPVCVIAYDGQLNNVRREVIRRKNVSLLDDPILFSLWENFVIRAWKTNPAAIRAFQEKRIQGIYRLGANRRYYAFDINSPFDKFIYLDVDTLLMSSLQGIFDRLDEHDFIVYDFQHKHPKHVYNLQSPKLFKVFDKARIERDIFCAGFFASRKGLFSQEKLERLISHLADGESEILYPWAPNQSLLNYMVMRLGIPVYNLALSLPKRKVSGNSVTNMHFYNKKHILYERGVRLTYLHYIGISSELFRRLCVGEEVNFPYKENFLYYRYLYEPQKRPVFRSRPKPYFEARGLVKKVYKKLKLVYAGIFK